MAGSVARWAALAGCLAGGAVGWARLADVPADPPAEGFSATRAMALVRGWATAPRPSGSPQHAATLSSVSDALTAAGFVVTPHPFTIGDVRGVNLVATAPGADDRDGVWLVAHSDSAPESPGASDDGFGLAVVVEAARALAVDGPPADLKVLITDAEELGLYGARAEVARAKGARRVVLNVEARGASGPVYMFQTAGPTRPVLAAWQRSGCRVQATSLARTVYDALPNATDFLVFRRAGWTGYDFALIHDAWRYHTPDDTPAGLDPRSVQQAGDCVTGLARAWLDAGGAAAATGPEDAAVYAQIAGTTFVVPSVVVRLAGAAALVVALARRRPDARGGVVLGVGAWLGAAVASVAAGVAMLVLFPYVQPDFWERVAEAPGAEGRFVALAVVGGVVPAAALTLARRWGPAERGWHGVSALLGAAAAIVAPTVGYAFVPGAFAAAFALRGRPWMAGGAAFAAGVVVAPVLQAIYPALTSRAAPVLAAMPLLMLAWLAPGVRREGAASQRR